MEWTKKGDLVVCAMDVDEFESLLGALQDARDTLTPLSRQNFPADYAASILESMSGMAEVHSSQPWTAEEDAALAEAWRSWGHPLSHGAFMQRLQAEPPHPSLAQRTNRAVAQRLAKLDLVKGRRPRRSPEQA